VGGNTGKSGKTKVLEGKLSIKGEKSTDQSGAVQKLLTKNPDFLQGAPVQTFCKHCEELIREADTSKMEKTAEARPSGLQELVEKLVNVT